MIEGLLHIVRDKIEQVDVKDLLDGRVVFLSRKTIDNEPTRIEASFVEEGCLYKPDLSRRCTYCLARPRQPGLQ